jgi:Tol biopolymer transport system component
MSRRIWYSLWILACVFAVSCRHPAAQTPGPVSSEFANPQRVVIAGYDGDAMEPFLSRDGKYLFFNNLNEKQVNTNLHWAERVDDLHFQYRGELQGVNTAALEGVPSMDRDGHFYFVSNRSYDQTASTLYRGKFSAGKITDIELVPGVSIAKPGIVNFDEEISADGETLYFVESEFSMLGNPKWAHILIAHRRGNTFIRDSASAATMTEVNAGTLNYAPSISADQRELYFTRVGTDGPAIYVAKRDRIDQAFGRPARLSAITGFVEGPTLSPDQKSLYFHKKDNGHFVIYRVTRP